jgi:hypothetical protein
MTSLTVWRSFGVFRTINPNRNWRASPQTTARHGTGGRRSDRFDRSRPIP